MVSEAKKKSQARWDAENCVRVTMKFNRRTDKELIEFLDKVDSKQGTIREALRLYLEQKKTEEG